MVVDVDERVRGYHAEVSNDQADGGTLVEAGRTAMHGSALPAGASNVRQLLLSVCFLARADKSISLERARQLRAIGTWYMATEAMLAKHE